jgi:5'-nucleotidase
MKLILLTNDDGYKSAGILALQQALSKDFEVIVVAPGSERSWMGKSMSAHNAITLTKRTYRGNTVYVCSGTPADCTRLGLYEICKQPPAFVVSGINIGSNFGHGRILSSGTVGAAIEGAIDGVKSVAISLCDTGNRGIDYCDPSSTIYFETAAQLCANLLSSVEDSTYAEGIDVLSVNVPFEATIDAEIVITRPSTSSYGRLFAQSEVAADTYRHNGASFRNEPESNALPGTDLAAILNGQISIAPLDISMSAPGTRSHLEKNLLPKLS